MIGMTTQLRSPQRSFRLRKVSPLGTWVRRAATLLMLNSVWIPSVAMAQPDTHAEGEEMAEMVNLGDLQQVERQLAEIRRDPARHVLEIKQIYNKWKMGNDIKVPSIQANYRFHMIDIRNQLAAIDGRDNTNLHEQAGFGTLKPSTRMVPKRTTGRVRSRQPFSADIQYLTSFPRLPEGTSSWQVQEIDIRFYPRFESIIGGKKVADQIRPLFSRGAVAQGQGNSTAAAEYGRQITGILNENGITNEQLRDALGMTTAQAAQWRKLISQGRFIDTTNIAQQSAWTDSMLQNFEDIAAGVSRQDTQVAVVINGEKEWQLGDTPLLLRGDASLWPVEVRRQQLGVAQNERGEYVFRFGDERKRMRMGGEAGLALARTFGRYREIHLRVALEHVPKELIDLNKANLIGRIELTGVEYSGRVQPIGEVPIYLAGKLGVDIVHGRQSGTVGATSFEGTVGIGIPNETIPLMFAIDLKWWMNQSPELQRMPLVIRAGPRAEFQAGGRYLHVLVYGKAGIPGATLRGEEGGPIGKGKEVGGGGSIALGRRLGIFRQVSLCVEATRRDLELGGVGLPIEGTREKNPWQFATILEAKF